MNEWACRNVNASMFIRYALGDESHIRTELNAGRATCVFSDDRARQLQLEFFGEAVAIGDLRAFLEVARAVRTTIRAAEKSPDGIWRREETL